MPTEPGPFRRPNPRGPNEIVRVLQRIDPKTGAGNTTQTSVAVGEQHARAEELAAEYRRVANPLEKLILGFCPQDGFVRGAERPEHARHVGP